MIINQVEILPGHQENIDVNIARLPSHSPINLSITIARSERPELVLMLSGGLHGDEINGPELVPLA